MQHQFNRHDRVHSLLTSLIATFIRDEANPDPLITVMNVTTSSDYRRATVFVTTIPESREEDALVFLKRKATELRGYLKRRSNLKTIPYLDFKIDRGERHRQHIDEIARDIKEKNDT